MLQHAVLVICFAAVFIPAKAQNNVNTGSIVYDELEFTNVRMMYDLVKDQVIVLHYNGFTKIGLVSEKVKEFND